MSLTFFACCDDEIWKFVSFEAPMFLAAHFLSLNNSFPIKESEWKELYYYPAYEWYFIKSFEETK